MVKLGKIAAPVPRWSGSLRFVGSKADSKAGLSTCAAGAGSAQPGRAVSPTGTGEYLYCLSSGRRSVIINQTFLPHSPYFLVCFCPSSYNEESSAPDRGAFFDPTCNGGNIALKANRRNIGLGNLCLNRGTVIVAAIYDQMMRCSIRGRFEKKEFIEIFHFG